MTKTVLLLAKLHCCLRTIERLVCTNGRGSSCRQPTPIGTSGNKSEHYHRWDAKVAAGGLPNSNAPGPWWKSRGMGIVLAVLV
jgi:hypothetical protein